MTTSLKESAFRQRPNPGRTLTDCSPPRQSEHPDSTSIARPPSPDAISTTSDEGSNYHAIQAKNIIQIDLQNPRFISREQQSILKSALELVSTMASHQPPTALEEGSHLHDPPGTIPKVPPRELLFMLLPGIDI